MHTEVEALELWCPMARYTYGGISYNRHHHPTEAEIIPSRCMCIASKCGMWRWVGHVDKWTDGTIHTASGGPASGYCGLAGKPK